MGLTFIPQQINKSSLTIDLGKHILGNRIISAEVPFDRPDMIKLVPMAAHLFNTLNSDQALCAGALRTVSFARVGNTDRITMALHSDARTRVLTWNDSAMKVAASLITAKMSTPLNASALATVKGATYTEYTPKNESEQNACDAVFEALVDKTNRDGGSMVILGAEFKEKSSGGFLGMRSKGPGYELTVKASGTCGGCSSDSITFAMARKKANAALPADRQVQEIKTHPQAAQLLVRLAR